MKNPLRVGVAVIALLLLTFSSVTATWCNSDFGKKAPILINNTGGSAQTHYQVELNFTHDSDMNANFSDIRVYNESDCSLVPLWNESAVASSYNKIWVNTTNIPASGWCNDTYYLYYNYSSASSASNITTTFLFGDDFNKESEKPIESSFGDWSTNRASYIVGNYVYVTEYNGMHVVDISDKANPSIVGNLSISGGEVLDINVDGDYAYCSVYGGDKLVVVNISDPTNPTEVGSVTDHTTLNYIHGIYKYGDYVYCACAESHRFAIVNVSDPTNPTVCSSIYDGDKLNVVHDVVVEGNYAYTATHFSGIANEGRITIINVSDVDNPSIVGSISSTQLYGGSDIQKSGDYVYTGRSSSVAASRWIASINVSNVSSPTIADRITGYGGYVCAIYDNHLYLSDNYNSVNTVDISIPTSLSLVKHYSYLPLYATHVFLTADGAYLIVACNRLSPTTEKFYIINRTDMLAYGNPIDTDKWDTTGASGSWSLSSNTLKASGSGVLKSKYSFPTTGVLSVKIKKDTGDNIQAYIRYVDANNKILSDFGNDASHNKRNFGVKESGSWTTDIADTVLWDWGVWYNFELIEYPSGTYKFTSAKIDGSDSNVIDATDSVGFSGNLTLAISVGDGYFDDILVRKYSSPEPTAQLGDEESPSATYIPPNPTNLQNTTGNFWVNYTWDAGSGNVTNGYNVSNGTVWANNTNTFYNESVSASEWVNITVYAWNSSGSGTLSASSVSDQVQVSAATDTTFTVSLPTGYTKPIFEPPNSTATNYPPNGQTSSQEFFNVTNSGNVNLDVRMRLNTTVNTITLKADSDNNPTGADTIGTSLVTIYSGLGQGSSVDIWLWSDFDHTPTQTANRTVYINVSQS